MGYGGGVGWLWLWWLLILVGVPALVVGLLWLARTGGDQGGGRGAKASRPRTSTARQILDERFARGEIDEEEYRTRRRALDD
jgi:putative membrane protein